MTNFKRKSGTEIAFVRNAPIGTFLLRLFGFVSYFVLRTSNLRNVRTHHDRTFFDVSPGIVASQFEVPSSSVKRYVGMWAFLATRSCFLGSCSQATPLRVRCLRLFRGELDLKWYMGA